MPSAVPTMAETGVPLKDDGAGPGPLSGSLRKNTDDDAPHPSGPGNDWAKPPNHTYETAEEEKNRIQREERERVLRFGPSKAGPSAGNLLPPSAGGSENHESAEEEKKRLEREERERVLRADRDGHPQDDDPKDEPPAYDG